MQQAGIFRPVLVLLIFLASLFLIAKTSLYFYKVELGQLTPDEQIAYREQHKIITLGLDLQGGLEAVMEVDARETIAQELRHSQQGLLKVLKSEPIPVVEVKVAESQPAIRLQIRYEQDLKNTISILKNYMQDYDWDEDALRQNLSTLLRLKPGVEQRIVSEGLDSAFKKLQNRLNVLGLQQPSIVKQGSKRIVIQIPGVTSLQTAAEPGAEAVSNSILDLLKKPAQLKFHLVARDSAQKVAELIQDDYQSESLDEGQGQGRKIKFTVNPKTGRIEVPLKPGVVVPPGYIFVPGYHSAKNRKTLTWYLVKEEPEMTGSNLRNASPQYNPGSLDSPYYVSIAFDKTGADDFGRVTGNNVGEFLGVVLDGVLFSSPRINSAIPNGQAIIEGTFTFQEVRELALVLKAGALPTPMDLVYSRTIEPTLGAESIKLGVMALVIGAIVVVAFMLIYYGFAGLIADCAVIMNVCIVLAILALANATLTLSGIAGILLTLGMAVDANVLIYERIREELKAGATPRAAIKTAFEKVFWTIFDANFTTLITALVLYHFGTGSVIGFATTMTIGIIITLYTGIFATRVLTETFSGPRGVSTGKIQLIPDSTNFNFIKMRHGAYVCSLLMILIGVGAIISQGGVQYSVDFEGGVQLEITSPKTANSIELTSQLQAQKYISNVKVIKIKGEDKYTIRHKLIEPTAQNLAMLQDKSELPENTADVDATDFTQSLLKQALTAALGPVPANYSIDQNTSIGGEVGSEFWASAIWVTIFASLLILVYIWFRFQVIYGFAAVLALFHDMFITLGLLVLLKVEISLDIVAALLVVMGYSLNDTIVIFDRIRESVRTHFGHGYQDVLNQSINACLNRTIITSGTTLFTTIVLLLLGGEALRSFALTLTIGIIVGTYSSSFVATPVLFEWQKRRKHEAAHEADQPREARPAKSFQSKGATAAGRARTLES